MRGGYPPWGHPESLARNRSTFEGLSKPANKPLLPPPDLPEGAHPLRQPVRDIASDVEFALVGEP